MIDENVLIKLKKLYYGAQDKFFDEHELLNQNNDINPPDYDFDNIETRTFTYDVYEINKDNHFIHMIKHKEIDEGYTNFKISPSENINKITLEIGGEIIENNTLFKHLGQEPTFYSMNKKVLPSLCYHKNIIKIYTDIPGKYTITYDVVKNKKQNLYLSNSENVSIIYQEQCTNKIYEHIESSIKLNVNMNHPIVEMYIFTNFKEIEDIRLSIDEHTDLIPVKKDNYYYIYFGDKYAVNFSRIDEGIMKVKSKVSIQNPELYIYGIGKQAIKIKRGLSGQFFSK